MRGYGVGSQKGNQKRPARAVAVSRFRRGWVGQLQVSFPHKHNATA